MKRVYIITHEDIHPPSSELYKVPQDSEYLGTWHVLVIVSEGEVNVPRIHKLSHERQGVNTLDLPSLVIFYLNLNFLCILYLFYYTIVILIDNITEFLFHARKYS